MRDDTSFPGRACITNASCGNVNRGRRYTSVLQHAETLDTSLIDADASVVEYGSARLCCNPVTRSACQNTTV